jgi:hypothetical protein
MIQCGEFWNNIFLQKIFLQKNLHFVFQNLQHESLRIFLEVKSAFFQILFNIDINYNVKYNSSLELSLKDFYYYQNQKFNRPIMVIPIYSSGWADSHQKVKRGSQTGKDASIPSKLKMESR